MNDRQIITYEERSLMSIYNAAGTREGLIAELAAMREHLDADETDLLALTDSALGKLCAMTDAEYAVQDLTPEFDL